MRWTAKRKLHIVRRYLAGHLKEVDALLSDNGISAAEFSEWLARATARGLEGLKVTKLARAP